NVALDREPIREQRDTLFFARQPHAKHPAATQIEVAADLGAAQTQVRADFETSGIGFGRDRLADFQRAGCVQPIRLDLDRAAGDEEEADDARVIEIDLGAETTLHEPDLRGQLRALEIDRVRDIDAPELDQRNLALDLGDRFQEQPAQEFAADV